MTDGEKTDALLRMMDMHFVKFRQTRDIELKVNLAIWTALFVLGGFLANQRFHLDCPGWFIYCIISVVILFCHGFFGMVPTQRSLDRDSKYVADCNKAIQELINTSIEYPPLQQCWRWFMVGFSGAILAGIAILLALVDHAHA